MRFIKAVLGFLILALNRRVFKPKTLFKGRTVAIIGPASSSFEELNGSYIDGFDFVIRINKAPYALKPENRSAIGSKTDVLFHSFFENGDTGGGKLDFSLYRELGVHYVVNPRSDFKGWRQTFNFYKKYLATENVFMLPVKTYKSMIEPFHKYWPTIGYCAIYSALIADFDKLYISGFTFFKTPYAKGYRDNLLDMEINDKHIKAHGLHSPDLELKCFLQLLAKNKMKNIEMDEALKSIVEEYDYLR